jgi:membrane-bound lytic murein transglycosylase D
MERVAERAEPYLHHIVEEIERRGLPMELALLPIVESAFQPFAYSPGRAAGIWQFIPSTGRHFGLEQTWWYDGRRDVIASTDAALTYLERLHAQFGDWELALAAYNAGQGTVRGAITRNTRAGKPTDYWNLPLPNETRGYVPRLMALRTLIEHPEKHGQTLRALANEPYLTVVETGGQLDLALAATLAELPIEEIYRLNPGFNRWATDPNGPHRLVLPIDRADQFSAGLAQLPEEKRVRWHRHQVASGQTLSHIARDYRTTVAVIQQANGLRDHRIRVGSHLVVPVAREAAGHYSLSQPQRQQQLQAVQRDGQRHLHQVQRGDTLWDLARNYNVSVNQITRWNGMAPNDLLRPGQQLVIWLPGGTTQAAAVRVHAPPAQLQSVTYTVRRGDSLYTIAKRFNVTIAQLREWNGLPQRGYLQPGQRLTLKVDVTQQYGRSS